MTALVVIDPGLSSGICVGEYSDTEPFRPTHAFQIEGGLMGSSSDSYSLRIQILTSRR